MAQMSRNIFVLFLLCVVLLIVVGVAFPSYLSRKNTKLRSTFNSSVVSFNALPSEKLIFRSTDANVFNRSEITFRSTSNGIPTESNISQGTSNSSLMPFNVKRRLKRQISDNGSELFDWNFHINVTRYRKVNEEKSEDLNAIKRSGVAVYLQSKEPKNIAFNEMQTAFKSVESFFRDFFKISFKNTTNDKKEKVQYFTELPWVEPDHTAIDSFDDNTKTLSKQPDMEDNETNRSLNKSLQLSEQLSSENIDKLELDSGNDSSIQPDREARIFFGLFNLGGKSLRKTTPEPEKPPLTADDDMNKNIVINENLSDPLPHVAVFVTEDSQQETIFHADSFRSETEGSVIKPNEQKADKSDLFFVTRKDDCLGCNADKTENPNLANEKDSSKTALDTTIKHIEHLTDKTLRNLCMQILKESPIPFNEEEKAFENQLSSSQNLLVDSLNSPMTNEVEELNTRFEVDENLITSREESPISENAVGKQARFLNIFGLGSGRSEIISEGNLIFEKEPDEPKFTNLPSVSDCEKFTNDWKKEINSKRNPVTELITTSDVHELNPNQERKSLEGVINLEGDENRTSFVTEVSFEINEDQREIKRDNMNTEENNESSSELVESEVNSKQTVQDTTDGPRDGRIFSFFDFGSGNGQDANMSDNRSFLGFFSSGMRSLDSSESDESNDLGSGIPFQGKASVDESYSSQEDIYEDMSATSIQERRFLEVFGIEGSGEGREIADSTDSITEYNVDIDCEKDCSHKVTEQHYECNDNCDLENYMNSSSEFSQTNSKGDCEGSCNTSVVEMHSKDVENLTSESLGLGSSVSSESFLLRKNSETKNISNEATDDECDNCDYENFINLKPEIESEAPSYIIEPTEQIYENTFDEDHGSQIHPRTSSDVFGLEYYSTERFMDHDQNTETSVIEHETTQKSRRFMGTIFLTGSGDGGLFGGDGGPINLVEEENTVSSNRNARRRGRLDDIDFGDFFNGISQNPFDNGLLDFSTESNSQELVPLSDRPEDRFITDKSGTEDFSPVTFLASPNITQTKIQIQPRSCSRARDCNDTLNERCITVSASSICDCGRSFVRHKETGKCVAKKLVEASLKLPKESFDEDLRNPASPRYKQMTEKSLETIYILLNETPNILRVVTDVNIAGFTSGSLIVKLNLVLAAENDNSSQNLKDIENELQKALQDEKVLKRASLNVTNASFLPLKSEVNRCKSSELNYCSKYANCIWNEDYAGGFLCKCKEHYLDVSTSPFYPGEICVAKCPASYCGTNGHCEPLGNDKYHCICYGLYFGERCEYPGVVVLGSLSVVALISLIIVFVVILKLRCRSTNYGRTPTFRREDTPGHAIANCRVSDAIALGESREMKVSKFTQISTPVQEPPLIKVTRPTLNESSISFDCDSTFDVSNNTEKNV